MRSAAALLVAGLLQGCAARSIPTPAAATAPAAIVHEIRSVADLAARFDRDREHPRLVLLLSPT